MTLPCAGLPSNLKDGMLYIVCIDVDSRVLSNEV
jgi:hypothetical protein